MSLQPDTLFGVSGLRQQGCRAQQRTAGQPHPICATARQPAYAHHRGRWCAL